MMIRILFLAKNGYLIFDLGEPKMISKYRIGNKRKTTRDQDKYFLRQWILEGSNGEVNPSSTASPLPVNNRYDSDQMMKNTHCTYTSGV